MNLKQSWRRMKHNDKYSYTQDIKMFYALLSWLLELPFYDFIKIDFYIVG